MPLLLTCAAAIAGLILGDLLPVRASAVVLAAALSLAGASLCAVAVRTGRTDRDEDPAPPAPGLRRLALAGVLAGAASLGALRATTPVVLALPALDLTSAAGPVRAALAAGLARDVPQPQAALASGILLGGSQDLDPALKQDLARAGLSHLLAIDGFKMVVVWTTLSLVAVPLLGRRRAAPLLLAVLAGFVLLTGAHASAVRAALMVALATTAMLIGRLPDPLTSVLVVALVMLAIEPRLLHDLGFQLSFSATLSLILLTRRLRALARRMRIVQRRLPDAIIDPVVLTVAVTLGTLPVVLHVFARVSLISPLAHVLAVPLVAPIMLASALVGTLAALGLPTGPLAWAVWLPATALIDVSRAAAQAPGASVPTGRLPLGAAAALGLGLLAWGVYGLPELRELRSRVALARRRYPHAGARLGIPLAAALAGLSALMVRPDGTAHVTPLTVRGGHAVLIRGPTGSTTLVLSGQPSPTALASRVADQLAVWQPGLDLVVATDPAARTVAGGLAAYYPIGRTLLVTTDARVDIGGGAMLDLYGAADTRNPSAALSYQGGATWLPLRSGR